MKSLIGLAALLSASAFAAAPLTYSGGTNIPSFINYDPVPLLTPVFSAGVEDALISSSDGAPIRVTFLGKEAFDLNQFLVNGNVILDNLASAPSTYGPLAVGAGPLNFAFRDTTVGPTTVSNGGAMSQFASYAILGSFVGITFVPYKGAFNEFEFVLGFNDAANVDADYDDLVVGIAAIPEPSTYALMLAGLGAIGFMARRRKSA